MTVSTTSTRISYAGTGTTGPFDIPFKIFADGDVVVTKTVDATGVATTLTLTTDYSISGAGAAGADLTTVAAVSSGETLLIYLDLDISQGTDFVNNDGWDADVAENAWDRNTLIARQINDSKIAFAVTAPASDSAPDMELPSETDRANKLLGFDANGDVSVSVSTAGSLLDEDDMASDSDTQGSTQQAIKAYVDSGTVTMTNKTLTTPTIASFANATHDHADAAGGGSITTGKILQVVSGTQGTAVTTSSTSYIDGNFSTEITTTVENSKILILGTIATTINNGSAAASALVNLSRGAWNGTQLEEKEQQSSSGAPDQIAGTLSFMYLDSPALSASTAQSYSFGVRAIAGTTSVTIHDGRATTAPDSRIILMEVAP